MFLIKFYNFNKNILFREVNVGMKRFLLISAVILGFLYIRNREISEMLDYYSVEFEEEED